MVHSVSDPSAMRLMESRYAEDAGGERRDNPITPNNDASGRSVFAENSEAQFATWSQWMMSRPFLIGASKNP
jgi:hypothetical protein